MTAVKRRGLGWVGGGGLEVGTVLWTMTASRLSPRLWTSPGETRTDASSENSTALVVKRETGSKHRCKTQEQSPIDTLEATCCVCDAWLNIFERSQQWEKARVVMASGHACAGHVVFRDVHVCGRSFVMKRYCFSFY